MADDTPRLTNVDLVTEVMMSFVGKPIVPATLRKMERQVAFRTGRKAWCDTALNPPQVVASIGIRLVFMEPDYEIKVALLPATDGSPVSIN